MTLQPSSNIFEHEGGGKWHFRVREIAFCALVAKTCIYIGEVLSGSKLIPSFLKVEQSKPYASETPAQIWYPRGARASAKGELSRPNLLRRFQKIILDKSTTPSLRSSPPVPICNPSNAVDIPFQPCCRIRPCDVGRAAAPPASSLSPRAFPFDIATTLPVVLI